MNAELRDYAIREIGCVVCLLLRLGPTPCAKHHLLTTGRHGNGKRRGEQATVGLCDYHHQGKQQVGSAEAARLYPTHGPSYADNAREFRLRWPDELLLTTQNRLLDEWQDNNRLISA